MTTTNRTNRIPADAKPIDPALIFEVVQPMQAMARDFAKMNRQADDHSVPGWEHTRDIVVQPTWGLVVVRERTADYVWFGVVNGSDYRATPANFDAATAQWQPTFAEHAKGCARCREAMSSARACPTGRELLAKPAARRSSRRRPAGA